MLASVVWLGAAAASEAYVFVADPAFHTEPGVRTMISLGRVAFLYDDALSDAIDLDESTVAGRVAGVSGRLAKGLLLDLPLVGLENGIVHEVFGHGARAREADLDVWYTFRLVPPYGRLLSALPEDLPVAAAHIDGSWPLERDILLDLAGVEAEHAAAWWLGVDMVRQGGWMHYGEMLQYGTFKLAYVHSLLSDQSRLPRRPGGNDVVNYVTGLQRRFDRWRPADRAEIATNLRRAYWFNFVDPTLWLAAWHGVVTYGFLGERDARFPSLGVGDWRLYPGTRFALSPFGAEHAVDLFLSRDGVVVDVYGRGASTGLASSLGAGVRVFGVPVGPRATVGFEVDGWRQPEILLEHRFVFDRGDRLGANAGLHLGWTLHEHVGLVGKIAYKGDGWVLALPVERGAHGYLGLSFTP